MKGYAVQNAGELDASVVDNYDDTDLEGMLYARHAELKTLGDLMGQRGTPIPALFNQFYRFIQNPSTVSLETYKRMIDTDDTIGSGVDFLLTCLSARVGRYTHPSSEVTDWVNRALDAIEGGFQNYMKEQLSGVWAGFSVGEKVWANDTELGFIIKKVVMLPPTTLLFETERTGELTRDGILQYQRNYNPAAPAFGVGSMYGWTSGAGGRNDPYARFGDFAFPVRSANAYSYLSIRIPVDKCVHFAFDAGGKFGNPYGRSLLRRAYKWWVLKDAFMQMMAVAMDRKGTPLTVVFADPHATVVPPSQQMQAQHGNPRGQAGLGKTAAQAAAEAFQNVHNDTTIILPGKKGQVYDLEFVPQDANAEAFINAINLCDRAQLRALLVPSLIFGNGDGTGSYSLGQEHAKTFDKILDGMSGGFKETLKRQVIEQLLRFNFPHSAWRKDGVGSFEHVEMSADEISKEIDILDKAVSMGAVDLNDLNDLNSVRSKIRMEPRTEVIAKPEPPMQFDENGDPVPGPEVGQPGADPQQLPPGAKKPPGAKPGGDEGEPTKVEEDAP